MDCPLCCEAMIVLEYEQVEIDHCVSCKSCWLDGGELELLLEHSKEKVDLLSSFEVEEQSNEKIRTCPICLKKMEKVLVGTKDSVRIDRCRSGDGLWFDLGEFERIVKMGNFGSNTKVLDWLKHVFSAALH